MENYIDSLIEKAFSDGYEYAQREFAINTKRTLRKIFRQGRLQDIKRAVPETHEITRVENTVGNKVRNFFGMTPKKTVTGTYTSVPGRYNATNLQHELENKTIDQINNIGNPRKLSPRRQQIYKQAVENRLKSLNESYNSLYKGKGKNASKRVLSSPWNSYGGELHSTIKI